MSMIVCPQCNGIKYTVAGYADETNAPNSTTFTAPTQQLPYVCNVCLGNGYFTGSMA